MAASRLLLVSIVLSFLIFGIRADSEVEDGTVVEASDSPLKLEMEQLKSKIAGLGRFGFDHFLIEARVFRGSICLLAVSYSICIRGREISWRSGVSFARLAFAIYFVQCSNSSRFSAFFLQFKGVNNHFLIFLYTKVETFCFHINGSCCRLFFLVILILSFLGFLDEILSFPLHVDVFLSFFRNLFTQESIISERSDEVKRKAERVAQLEKIIEEKSASMASLQSEVEMLQKKGIVAAQELVGKADARAGELEKQIEKLKNEIEAQTGKRGAYETRASEAEKKVRELNLKLESLERTHDEQRLGLQKSGYALQMAQEELAMMQLEARSKSDELKEVHGAWLPPWLANHIAHCQDLAATRWKKHGKPALDVFLQKASEKSTRAKEWVEPHLETAKTKWIPAVKERWLTLITYTGPHVQMVSTKTNEVYRICTDTITPHVVKVKELADPYFQEAKKFSKPYINQIASVSKPHVEKVRLVLKPYTKHAAHAYRKSLESATVYHHQIRAVIQEKFEKHEVTKPLASKELVWFMASALLVLPTFCAYRMFLSIFCKKTRTTQNANANHPSRKFSRRHADK